MHFYTTTGESCHEVPNEAARKRGEVGAMRDTTIRDAKKLRLLPSVTTYTKIIEKDWLNDAIKRRLCAAAHENRPLLGEAVEAYTDRLDGIAFKEWNDWRDLGGNVHAAIEAALNNQPYEEKYEAYVAGVKTWLLAYNVEVVATEKRLVSTELGCAGTTDLVCKIDGIDAIGDFKVTGIEPGDKPQKKEEYAMQLAIYHTMQYGQISRGTHCFNLLISRATPGYVVPVWFNCAELEKALRAFEHVCAVWRYVNDYDPRSFQ